PYTSDVKEYFGGASGVNTILASAVAYMNDAFMRSQITGRVRLAQATEMTWRGDTHNLNFESTLLAADSTASNMAAECGADMISEMFLPSDYLPQGGTSHCWSPLSVFFATGGNLEVFAHEIGHSLGCNHDHANQALSCNRFDFSYGNVFSA